MQAQNNRKGRRGKNPAVPCVLCGVAKINRRACPILANILMEGHSEGGVSAATTMSQRDHLLDQVRRLALRGMGERQTDGQLLELFISERDESAFALLLRRHGAMVWSVCRRVLGNAHDADDAFQAAFLVLVRKADSIRPRESVGNWLYGVAHRTALEARRRIARRRAKERSLPDMPLPESRPEEPWHELGPILDRELSRLSDKYRLPIVLCDLEGRSRKEVARQLAIPEGTLSSRLNTGRKKLAKRLARCGFTVSAAALGILLMEAASMASLSLSLLSATTKAALLVASGPTAATGIVSATARTLAEGVLKTMFIAKIKTAALVVCSVAALGIGTGGVYLQTRVGAADSPPSDRVVQDNGKRVPPPGEREIDKLKRENEQLKDMLERARNREKEFQTKLCDVVNNLAKLAEGAPRDLQKELIDEINNLTEKMSQAEAAARQPRPQPPLGPNAAFERMKAQHEQLVNEHRKRVDAIRKQHRELLDKQLQQFDKETRDRLAEAEKVNERILAGQATNQPSPSPSQKQVNGDKLDRILEYLERLEKRLDRLEKDRK